MLEEAKTAAQAFLTQRAKDAGSGETFVFESFAEEGSEIVLSYRAHHPDWVIYTHSLVTVAYDPRTKTVVSFRRPGMLPAERIRRLE